MKRIFAFLALLTLFLIASAFGTSFAATGHQLIVDSSWWNVAVEQTSPDRLLGNTAIEINATKHAIFTVNRPEVMLKYPGLGSDIVWAYATNEINFTGKNMGYATAFNDGNYTTYSGNVDVMTSLPGRICAAALLKMPQTGTEGMAITAINKYDSRFGFQLMDTFSANFSGSS